jgi:hypothetical protein
LTKDLLPTEQTKPCFGMIWEGIIYGSPSSFYEKETWAKNFAKYHSSSLPNYHAIYYCLCKFAYRDILGVAWTLPNGKLTKLN